MATLCHPSIRTCENATAQAAPLQVHRVDPENGVIRGVKILGLQSKNPARVLGLSPQEYGPEALNKPYRYDAQALARRAGLYEGVRVFVGHPEFIYSRDGGRKVASGAIESRTDVFGWLSNVQVRSDGLYGDLNYLTSHPRASQIAEAAQRNPRIVALSHLAMTHPELDRTRGEVVITDVTKVESVDLVFSQPGTTYGLFESAAPGEADGIWASESATELIGDVDALIESLETTAMATADQLDPAIDEKLKALAAEAEQIAADELAAESEAAENTAQQSQTPFPPDQLPPAALAPQQQAQEMAPPPEQQPAQQPPMPPQQTQEMAPPPGPNDQPQTPMEGVEGEGEATADAKIKEGFREAIAALLDQNLDDKQLLKQLSMMLKAKRSAAEAMNPQAQAPDGEELVDEAPDGEGLKEKKPPMAKESADSGDVYAVLRRACRREPGQGGHAARWRGAGIVHPVAQGLRVTSLRSAQRAP